MRARVAWVAALLAMIVVAPVRAEVVLGPGAVGATVRDSDGRPVDGALVTVDGPTTREATTSVAGVVTLDALPLGTYALRVRRAGFAPYATWVTLGAAGRAIANVAVRVIPAPFADLRALDDATSVPLDAAPRIGASLVRDVVLDVVPARGGLGLALAGASPAETQLELDGIPLPASAASTAALLERTRFGLADVALARGPTLGGIVDVRTPDGDGVRGALGYDSTSGSFADAGATARVGRDALLAEIVDGAAFRSQTLEARGVLVPGVALDVASYGARSTFDLGATHAVLEMPAFTAGVRAMLGRATLSARTFASATRVDGIGAPTDALGPSDARVRGDSLAFALPIGGDALTIGYERRGERDVARDGSVATRSIATLAFGTDLRLSATTRLELGDSYARGAALGTRHDPSIGIALRADARTTLRIGAGSAYALAPDLFASAGSVRPETSLGVRARIDEALLDGGRAWVAFDDVRRFDRYASLADARALGIEFGIERPPAPDRIDATFAVRLERLRAFGATQPAARVALASATDASANAKAHLDLGFTGGATRTSLGLTVLAGNAAFGTHATTLADARVRMRFANVVDAAIGVENMFGAIARDPALAPLLPPHELTLTIGPARSP